MKTAMQEFLDWVQIYCDNQPYLIPEEAKKKATELLEKEKEQIVNAYTIGNRNGLDNKALWDIVADKFQSWVDNDYDERAASDVVEQELSPNYILRKK